MVMAVGITPAQLCQRYPVLYHMASFGSWPMIRKHGLLSTAALLDLFEVPEPKYTELLTTQRKTSITITHSRHGTAVLRDQKPLSSKNLARCLVDCEATEWYRLLNERVFFWLNPDRLLTLLSAAEYRAKIHTVLYVDTKQLVDQHFGNIELAHMNTGNTLPMPHPRGRHTFRRMDDYEYQRRCRLPDYSAVVELTAIGGVRDIYQYVKRVEHASSQDGVYQTAEVLFERKDHPRRK